ncbi:MAG: nuclear transport factor 2 family protein [Arenimonas sp.]
MSSNPIGAYPRCAGKRAGYWLGGLLLLLCLGLSGCSKPAPEQALRDSIQKMEQAAVKKDADEFFEYFAEDFSGSDGMDRENFRRYVQLIWLRNKDIGVQIGPLDVKMMDDRATVNFTVALTGGQGLLPDRGQIYQVQTGWRQQGDEWRLISATWKPAL